MKKFLILLILSSISAIAMDADDESSHAGGAASSAQLQHAHHDVHDDDSDISTQTDTDEDDELAQLAENTVDPHADPRTTTRGFHPFGIGKKKKRRRRKAKAPASDQSSDDEEHYGHVYASTSFGTGAGGGFTTHEATYDDVVRMIQSNSRFALSEARTLNRQYLDAVLAQLQEGIVGMQEAMGGDAQRVVGLMEDLQGRLAHVEKLLPKVDRLLQEDATIAGQYERTCQELIRAFQLYAQEVQEREDTHGRTLELINTRLRSMGQTLGTVSRNTGSIADTTRDIRGDVRMNRLKDVVARYTVGTIAGGAITLLIMWILGSDYTRDMEMNDSLQEEA